MFNLILALSVGIIIGWNFNAFFQALDAPRIIRNDINLSENILEKSVEKPLEKSNEDTTVVKHLSEPKILKKVVTQKHLPKESSFYTLLHKNLFSDALSLYIDAKEKDVLFYRATIEKYFRKKIKENDDDAILQIIEYLELEPDNNTVKILLSNAYKDSKEYEEAIIIISEVLDTSLQEEIPTLEINLINTMQQYIRLIKKSNNIDELIYFIKSQIDYGLNIPFFSITLAKEYILLKQNTPAIKLLKEIEFDEKYGEEAKMLLDDIQNGTTNSKEYTYQLPLTKTGAHFTVEVIAEDTPLTLLLDTGASLTMVNEEKIASFTILNDHLTLQTAGGDISAQLHVAETFKMGNIELKDFKITTSSFKQEKADGLLGMNFFKLFKFKIDQEAAILYLSKK